MNKLPREIIEQFIYAITHDLSKADLMLQEHPDLLNARWYGDATIMQHLAREHRVDAVQFFVEKGADFDAKDKAGNSALIDVCLLGDLQLAEIFVEAGANVCLISNSFETPILSAVRSGNAKIVELLLNAGDPAYRSPAGKTIFDVLPPKGSTRRAIYRVLEKFAPPLKIE